VSQRIDALICPRWTIPVEPEVSVREDLCLAIHKGRILALASRVDALKLYAPDTIHERPDHVLLPGLVNTHTHAAMTLMRGYGEDMSLERWLNERIWPTEVRLMSSDFVADGVRLAISEMLLGGITCFADMYFYPDRASEVAAESGIRMVVGMIAIEFPTPWAADAAECISKGLAVHDVYRTQPLISTMFAPHAPYTVSDSTLKRIRQLADELDVPVQMHIHETAKEVEDALAEDGRRPLERLETLGLLTPALMAVHATQLTPGEVSTLAKAGCSVVHCPRSNLKLVSGACPVADLVDAGVNVSLGTDGAAANNRLDLWSEMNTAALFGKFVAGDAAALPAGTIIELATLNGARALSLEAEIGSLLEGKSADAVCVELGNPGTRPVLDPLSQLVYAAGRENVTDVWVAGEHLVKGGGLARMDVGSILQKADEWAERITAS
jgi:5-methylthioadenosine/S-adenosylhomocysteine deaminase